jgi:hypothetical protein
MLLFGQYGATTKDQSNDYVGSFGIGSKSALAIADSMTIRVRKNGREGTIIVGRNEFGRGTLTVVGDGHTFEPNGVQVEVPIRSSQVSEFQRVTNEFFRFWNPNEILVNGKAPDVMTGQEIANGRFVVIPQRLSSDFVIMGNVAYKIADSENRLGSSYYRRQSILFNAEIGDVDIAPSREELLYSPRTRAFLDKAAKEFKAHVLQDAIENVKKAKTPAEAFLIAQEWRRGEFVNADQSFTHNGLKIPTNFYLPGYTGRYGSAPKKWIALFDPHGYGRSKSKAIGEIDERLVTALVDGDAVFITGYDTYSTDKWGSTTAKAPSTSIRKKLEVYNNGRKKLFLFTDTIPCSPWLDSMPSWDIEDIRAIKLPRQQNSGGFGPRGIDYYEGQRTENVSTIDDLPDDKDIVVLVPPGNFRTDDERTKLNYALNLFSGEALFVRLGVNRWEKFKREWEGEVYSISEFVKNKARAYVPDQDVIDAIAQTGSWRFEDGVDDPDLKEYNRLRKVDTSDHHTMERVARAFGFWQQINSPDPTDPHLQKRLRQRYPLLGKIYGYELNTPDVTIYLNAVFSKGEN